ncbi:MAG: 3-hydroxyacyl-CoA dehydrogenase NAD-binding domain-containing protein [Pseudomonadales bacterium]|nr:3-hydroxyacyl-CoA dehydrogenase NAD-binding domain-containing protein [Pseudomonadales bacterium]
MKPEQSKQDSEMSYQHWQPTLDHEDILWWRLDRAGESVNALASDVLEELEQLIAHAEAKPPRGIVLLSAKPTGFIYGADVREFSDFSSAEEVTPAIQRVHAMFNRLEQLPCPTVAAIEGYCLGGGLELALSCSYRIARDIPATKLGFPEIQLGIFPGFGGSARTVHRIGGMKGMELMLTARQVNARAAKAMGLIDEVVGRHESLQWAARRAVLAGRKSRKPGLLARLSNLGPVRTLLAGQMRKRTKSKARPEHYPAPYRLIETWERHGGNRQQMMQAEAIAVGKLMVTPAAVGLRRVFALMERLKSEARSSDFKARHVHVIGAGVMGGDIAAWCVLRGLDVSLQDRELKYIEPALKRARSLFTKKLRNPQKINAAMARLIPDVDGNRVGQADVVIEAIFENLEAKQALFRTLEPKLKKEAILATNTSAIPLEQLAEALKKPSRLIGLHFFNPVSQMPTVEVVAGKKSNKQQLRNGAAFCHQINRFPVQVKSSPGFLVNRVLAPYMLEALTLHLEGIPIEAIDAAAENFGMPMGPIELADTVGLDVCLMVTGILSKQTDAQTDNKEQHFIQDKVDAGKLGKKSGEGLYHWSKGKPVKNSEQIAGHDLEPIAERLLQAYLNECKAALEEKIVADEDLLDAGMIFGTGFAPFRGGPMAYLKTLAQKDTTHE